MRLGVRVEIARSRIPIASGLLVVPDGGAYIDAISRWRLDGRFPVLIDDGSDAAREDIARFVRAYRPTSVARWAGDGRLWAQSVEARRQRIEEAVASAWDAGKPEGVEASGAPKAVIEGLAGPVRDRLNAKWKELGFEPPGAVVMNDADPAWTAGLALAAGRGQRILWTDRAPENVGGAMSADDARALETWLASQLDVLETPWREAGDAIEAVTLASHIPGKVSAPSGTLALTDVLGRAEGAASAGGAVPRAYCVGLVWGTEAKAAYNAMCALFLEPRKAWLFEGYQGDPNDPKKAGFAQYAIKPAADALSGAGIETEAEDAARDALGAWRRRVSGGIDAGLIHVNSSGTRDWFVLKGARAESNDIPASLDAPAIVHFIHSFSAQDMGDANSIGARWLDAGAYAYVGSVDEPFLTAFHTPPTLVARLFAPAPFGVAARVDNTAPWKINVYGDPLLTHKPGVPTPRMEAWAPPEGSEPADDLLKRALADRSLDDAARWMAFLGRDADVIRLFLAAEQEAKKSAATVPPGVASAAFHAAARAGMPEPAARAFEAMDDARKADSRHIDLLWQSARDALEVTPTAPVVDALKGRLRPSSLADDAVAVAKAIGRVEGREQARQFAERIIRAAPAASKEAIGARLSIFLQG